LLKTEQKFSLKYKLRIFQSERKLSSAFVYSHGDHENLFVHLFFKITKDANCADCSFLHCTQLYLQKGIEESKIRNVTFWRREGKWETYLKKERRWVQKSSKKECLAFLKHNLINNLSLSLKKVHYNNEDRGIFVPPWNTFFVASQWLRGGNEIKMASNWKCEFVDFITTYRPIIKDTLT